MHAIRGGGQVSALPHLYLFAPVHRVLRLCACPCRLCGHTPRPTCTQCPGLLRGWVSSVGTPVAGSRASLHPLALLIFRDPPRKQFTSRKFQSSQQAVGWRSAWLGTRTAPGDLAHQCQETPGLRDWGLGFSVPLAGLLPLSQSPWQVVGCSGQGCVSAPPAGKFPFFSPSSFSRLQPGIPHRSPG